MNLNPEDAKKILDADLRNLVRKVSEGGVLSAAERSMLQNCAVPGGEAKGKRAAALLTKYGTGARLTASELAEIREVYPAFTMEAAPDSSAPAAPALTLTAEPSPSVGDAGLSRAQLNAWGELYGTQHRQLRRWIARGKERNDPCPLDYPEQMPSWWERCMDKPKRAPDKVLAAAANSARSKKAEDVPAVEQGSSTPPDADTPSAPAQNFIAINLSDFDGVEADAVRVFTRSFAAITAQIDEAYRLRDDALISKLTTRQERTGESLRKAKVAAEAEAKRRGELLSRSEVYHEVSAALAALQVMRDHMATRIKAEMPDLTPEQLDHLGASIEAVRALEDDILRNVSAYKSVKDVQLQLVS
ncbi:MAG: hypothetical protein ACFUZC_16530 [Chthoniobacteraceae bacterium]